MLGKIEYAGGNHDSFEQAADSLRRLADVEIGPKHVQRITCRLGRERADHRDRQVRALKDRRLVPVHVQPPTTVAIHLDAGKIQMRADDGRVGVREPHWRDTKAASLETYTTTARDTDPRPDPPEAFLDSVYVRRLCQEIAQVRGKPSTAPTAPKPSRCPRQCPDPPRPERLVRTAVATTGNAETFGWLVAAEATTRGFYGARHKAVVGDGGNWIVPLTELHFPGWRQVLDIVHLLSHLYAAATAAYPNHAHLAWRLYERMLRSAWAGNVPDVLTALTEQLARLNGPPDDKQHPADNHPPPEGKRSAADLLQATRNYVTTNAARMEYPRYRREGLPVSSAPIESLIKQFNDRVKGTEKFWNDGGGEAILQVRAAYLSQDGRAEDHYTRRPRPRAVGNHRLRIA